MVEWLEKHNEDNVWECMNLLECFNITMLSSTAYEAVFFSCLQTHVGEGKVQEGPRQPR